MIQGAVKIRPIHGNKQVKFNTLTLRLVEVDRGYSGVIKVQGQNRGGGDQLVGKVNLCVSIDLVKIGQDASTSVVFHENVPFFYGTKDEFAELFVRTPSMETYSDCYDGSYRVKAKQKSGSGALYLIPLSRMDLEVLRADCFQV